VAGYLKPEKLDCRNQDMEATGIILAGGKNRRYGRPKSLEIFEGKTLIERAVNKISKITGDIVVVTANEETNLPQMPSVRIVKDEYFEMGPLGGIFTGLKAAKFELGLVVATDMPFLSVPLSIHLLESAVGYDIVVPRHGDESLELLHAVYRKTTLSSIKNTLDNNRLRIRIILSELKVKYVDEAECRRYDPELRSFFNINYPSDLEKALKMEQDEVEND